jgi:hypothetical protein
MSIMRVAGLGAFASLGLIACADEDGFDPAAAAERGIHDQIYTELRLESTVTCADPADTAVGTTFSCDAVAEDGKEYRFVAVIMADEVIGTRLD